MKKIIIIIGSILISIFIVFMIVIWSVFGTEFMAAKSIIELEDGLYFMEYTGDYGFDGFLAQGGADSDAKMAEYVTMFLSKGFLKSETSETEKNFGCSTLVAESGDGSRLMGRNFDWEKCNSMIVYTKPEHGYESISTCCLDFLGFGRDWKPEGMKNQYMALAAIYVPLDGMNEKGLCVADLISGDEAEIHQDSEKVDLTIVSAIRLLLDRAATVDEAVFLLGEYDMNSSIGTSHHLSISDASGKAVVVEYIDNEMIVTDAQVVTNHYLSAGEKFGIGNEESHYRYNILVEMRQQTDGVMEEDKLRDCMKSVSYDGITQWSILYNKTNLTIDYYWQREYDLSYHFEIR